jgi:DNA processing protein
MNEVYTLQNDEIPFLLRQIPDKPERLHIKGTLPKEGTKLLCIVGARKHSSYGAEACKKLVAGLKGHNICIVSGLAIGIDGIAHRSALEAGLQTIAFPGSGLDEKVLYPPSHRKLADEILFAGGALLSEFDMGQEGAHWTFPQRNRLMAGISHATIVIEAEPLSGTLITSRLALDYNREVGAVPGSILSRLSEGPNDLIDNGAMMIKDSNDILELLGLKRKENVSIQQSLSIDRNENERKIINYLNVEPHTSEQLIQKMGVTAQELGITISSLEIEGVIVSVGNLFKIK